MSDLTSFDQIQKLKAEVASLEKAAIQELQARRKTVAAELASVEAEIARITRKSVGPGES